jgi:glucose-6-phosphate isomerase
VTVAIRHQELGPLAGPTAEAVAELHDREAVRRLWGGDHTLWSSDPTELADRLGWLHVPDEMAGALEEVMAVVGGCRADGLTDVVVMGMGGSSLFPEVVARSFPVGDGGLALQVLDATDPAAVARVVALDPATTLYVASSKSGTTIETRSHLELLWDHVGRGDRFVAITDPGSELAQLATERGFRHVFENRPDIGGRYSALSYFGLVPAALAGVAWTELVARAVTASSALRSDDPAVNVGLQLGAAMAAGVRTGRDKLTFAIDPRISSFGLWLEQLIAESTGKAGTGVIPVVEEPLAPIDDYGDDRLFVGIGHPDHATGLQVLADAGQPTIWLELDDPLDLGAQVLAWEVATALCGALLAINPFDQPDVAAAKAATARVLAEGASVLPATALAEVLASVAPGDYLALQAYLDPASPDVARLQEVRLELRDRHRVATTFGLGPRFLHSTGQLHKGGPPSGVFLQVLGDDPVDLAVPGQPFTFSQLKRAQADGDLLTLSERGLRAARTTVAELILHLDEPGVG